VPCRFAAWSLSRSPLARTIRARLRFAPLRSASAS
jgi:hypothetical protein